MKLLMQLLLKKTKSSQRHQTTFRLSELLLAVYTVLCATSSHCVDTLCRRHVCKKTVMSKHAVKQITKTKPLTHTHTHTAQTTSQRLRFLQQFSPDSYAEQYATDLHFTQRYFAVLLHTAHVFIAIRHHPLVFAIVASTCLRPLLAPIQSSECIWRCSAGAAVVTVAWVWCVWVRSRWRRR